MTNAATVLYIPHGGGPLPLLDEVGYKNMNAFLRGFRQTIEKPDAIVIVSAHWEEPCVSITANPEPPLLFDYFGFPPETYEYQYPVAGQPELASQAQQLLSKAGIDARLDQERGLDHGVFIPLMLMYPEAEIPCIQISLNNSLDAAYHIQLGKALADLKQQNLLILGSGYSFHNMSAFMSKHDDSIDEKNQAFESWLSQTCSDKGLSENEREQRLANWTQAPHARYCHPREEHLLPLQVCYGIAGAASKVPFQEQVTGFITSAYQW